MLEVLRLGGVPCRHASGYVHDPPGGDEGDPLLGSAASHAGMQAWHPELGGVGIDPSNDQLVDWQSILISTGRDDTDVQPCAAASPAPARRSSRSKSG